MTTDTPNIQELKRLLGALTYAEMRYVAERLSDFADSLTPLAIAEALADFAEEPTERPE